MNGADIRSAAVIKRSLYFMVLFDSKKLGRGPDARRNPSPLIPSPSERGKWYARVPRAIPTASGTAIPAPDIAAYSKRNQEIFRPPAQSFASHSGFDLDASGRSQPRSRRRQRST